MCSQFLGLCLYVCVWPDTCNRMWVHVWSCPWNPALPSCFFYAHKPRGIFFKITFYESEVALQCCIGFCCRAKWIMRIHMHAKSLQSCPTLWNHADCSPPGSSIHGILQAKLLEWVAMPSSRESSPPRDWTHVSCVTCIGRWVLYH